MSINPFRIAGGLGVEEPADPHQNYILQGIGYPLRPVDNVARTNAPDISDIVAQGEFMQWMGNWEAGLIYTKGSQVRDGSFIMLAINNTIEPAAPQPSGAATFSQPSYSPEAIDPSNISTISCGHSYTFTTEGWIKALRFWIPAISADITYRIVIIVTLPGVPPTTVTITNPLPAGVDQWTVVALLDQIVPVGAIVTVTLESLNSSADTVVQGPWIYQGATQTGAPPPQNWTIDNQRTTFRINKTDELGADRSADLESVIPETIIQVAEVAAPALTGAYRVTTVIDQGAYMNYAVVLINEAGGGPRAGQSTNVTLTIPTPLATEYAEELAVWPAGNPAWATVESFLFYDDVNQSVADSGFGVDIEFQPATVSDDWDIIVSQ